MRFSAYLNENKGMENEATLVLHKIIHMVDKGHVDMGESDIRFSVGPMISQGAYDGVKVVIRKSGESSGVRLAKFRQNEGNIAIVVDVEELPERSKIDTLLAKPEIFKEFVKAFVGYLQRFHDHKAEHNKHSSEIEADNNTNFEDNYTKLTKEFTKTNIEGYTKATESIRDELNNSADIIKRETSALSIKNLQKEYLGTTESEFLALMKKLPSYKSFENISKELKTKLESRLKTYYLSTVKPMLDTDQ